MTPSLQTLRYSQMLEDEALEGTKLNMVSEPGREGIDECAL